MSDPPGRGVYCNRTLNLSSIRAVGYDMDYTLVHYRVEEWERRAYEATRERVERLGWPTDRLTFQPELVIRGLVIDTELGNLVKADRFGYVKRAFHGTRLLGFDALRRAYSSELIDLRAPRWRFLNTLFSVSEGCLYAQLVDLLDAGDLPSHLGYEDLWRRVSALLDETHLEGAIKAEIAAAPERFVVLDPDVPRALLDQRAAGKRLLLITNAEWTYADAMLRYALERYLPAGTSWRDLFDVVIVGARKPHFFGDARTPLFEVVSEDGLLRPATGGLRPGGLFLGGSAALVEQHLGLSGDQLLYVGDHLLTDVFYSKSVLRWRTALVLRELEDEVAALARYRPRERELQALMEEKQRLEQRAAALRLAAARGEARGQEVDAALAALVALDQRVAPMAREAGEQGNARWGLLLRTGNDKSLLARQVERHADVYTSRVSNLLAPTPFAYFRSRRGPLPHDPA